jgi:CHAD domain-containing protein
MRVGLRRLRAALAFFSKLTLADAHVEHIKKDLKWISSELAPARDLDVYLRKSVQPVDGEKPSVTGASGLEQATERLRSSAFLKAGDAVRSKRYREIILDVAEWLNAGTWLDDSNPEAQAKRECPVVKFVANEMTRRRNKLAKKTKKLQKADAQARHKIRINAKKLRYASEFFASIFPGKKATKRRRSFSKSLKRLQSSLGDLNDFAVHEKLADRPVLSKRKKVRARRGRRRAFAAGVIAGKERSRSGPLLKAAKHALRDVAAAKQYWKN